MPGHGKREEREGVENQRVCCRWALSPSLDRSKLAAIDRFSTLAAVSLQLVSKIIL